MVRFLLIAVLTSGLSGCMLHGTCTSWRDTTWRETVCIKVQNGVCSQSTEVTKSKPVCNNWVCDPGYEKRDGDCLPPLTAAEKRARAPKLPFGRKIDPYQSQYMPKPPIVSGEECTVDCEYLSTAFCTRRVGRWECYEEASTCLRVHLSDLSEKDRYAKENLGITTTDPRFKNFCPQKFAWPK
ncbi:MAG: hypothetical protein JNK82_28315 [Myxococcaceae bacterium]|nr:hypothetical protein [Myxococcaceae bacterium]